ncbi:MAG: glycosyltransferase [Anaerolinea sp.]|nr:glycosyltransferase [Anaerolinea sp.]
MIHVLMISLDTALALHPQGDSRARHLAYAARAGKLTVICYTPPHTGGAIQASDSLTIIPTNSRHPVFFILDAIRLAERSLRKATIQLVTTQDPFATGIVGVWLRLRHHVPLLVQNHSYFFGNREWLAERPLRNRILRALGGIVVARADFYRTVNEKEKQNYLAAGGSRRRVAALPLGTASPAFADPPDPDKLAALRSRLGLTPADQVVLWIGYPVKFKRVPILFRVFKKVVSRVPSAKLVLIGDMARSPVDLAEQANSEGIGGCVIIDGPVPHSDLPLYYALGNVYAHTSSYEGVPRVLFEASAAGLPLVGMDVVGVNEVIENGVNGYLAPDMDIDGMAGRIITLLNDPLQAKAMGERARQIAFRRYDADRYIDTWVGIWRKAVRLGLRERRGILTL